MNDMYHRAARDSVIDMLKTATKRDATRRDEDGMTPLHYAASCGNVEALRVLVGKGGDPDKPTHEGMSAVHLAASCGQLNCLSFLTNFGANIWALNNDGRTALEEAALHNHMGCVRHLDGLVAVQKIQNKKKVDRLRRQAQKDATKRIRKEQKMKAQREKAYEKRVSRETSGRRSKSSVDYHSHRGRPASTGKSDEWVNNQRNGTLRNRGERSFSELAGVIYDDNKQDFVETGSVRSYSDTITSKSFLGSIRSKFSTLRGKNRETPAEPRLIKKKSVDSGLHSFYPHSVPTGLDSLDSLEVAQIQHSSHEIPSHSQTDSTENGSQGLGQMIKTVDSKGNSSTCIQYIPKKSPRMVNGSIASRFSHSSRFSYSASDILSIGSTDLEDSFSEVVFERLEVKCLVSFLSSLNLEQFSIPLIKESIDLSALSLLSDGDLQSLGLPLGPRRKILEAIKRRSAVLENPGLLRDSKI